MKLRLVAFLLAALSTPSPLLALEETGGTVQGTIADTTGVIPGVSVKLLNLETGLSRTVLANGSGVFTFPRTGLGTYQLSAGMIGFRELVYRGLTLHANEVMNLDVVMEMAEVSPPMAGEAGSPLIQEHKTLPLAVVPKGTQLQIRLLQSLHTEQNQTGDLFEASLDKEVAVDGEVVIARHTRITGKLVEVKASGRVKGRARMVLALTEIKLGSENYPIKTEELEFESKGTKGSDAKKIGTAAGVGAVIGVIAGGAGTGAVIGAGGGTGGVLLTKGKPVAFGAEHRFVFRLEEDLKVPAN